MVQTGRARWILVPSLQWSLHWIWVRSTTTIVSCCSTFSTRHWIAAISTQCGSRRKASVSDRSQVHAVVLSRLAMLESDLAVGGVSVCLSVCHTCWYWLKSNDRRTMRFSPQVALVVFLMPNFVTYVPGEHLFRELQTMWVRWQKAQIFDQ